MKNLHFTVSVPGYIHTGLGSKFPSPCGPAVTGSMVWTRPPQWWGYVWECVPALCRSYAPGSSRSSCRLRPAASASLVVPPSPVSAVLPPSISRTVPGVDARRWALRCAARSSLLQKRSLQTNLDIPSRICLFVCLFCWGCCDDGAYMTPRMCTCRWVNRQTSAATRAAPAAPIVSAAACGCVTGGCACSSAASSSLCAHHTPKDAWGRGGGLFLYILISDTKVITRIEVTTTSHKIAPHY